MQEVKELELKAGVTKILVVGLGVTGLASVDFLTKKGLKVFINDDNLEKLQNKSAILANAGIQDLTKLTEGEWKSFDYILLSPGINIFTKPHLSVQKAKIYNIPIISDLDILYHYYKNTHKFIGITGTNGKSTTTSLIYHILKEAGENILMLGNIGNAALSVDSNPSGKKGIIVLELSSFQLDIMHFNVDIGVLINITPDHLDRYHNFEHYIESKKQIFRSKKVIINIDDPECAKIKEEKFIPISRKDLDSLDLNYSYENYPGLKGQHNITNLLCAVAVMKELGLPWDKIKSGLQSFTALEHRMEPCRKLGNIEFINDSKATNPESSYHALNSFQNIYWISGGKWKDGANLNILKDVIGNVKELFLIGEASDIMEKEISLIAPNLPVNKCGNMETAVKISTEKALQNPSNSIILLSPCCSSFDQYKNYIDRGRHFKELVKKI